jgi:hypothetical protein
MCARCWDEHNAACEREKQRLRSAPAAHGTREGGERERVEEIRRNVANGDIALSVGSGVHEFDATVMLRDLLAALAARDSQLEEMRGCAERMAGRLDESWDWISEHIVEGEDSETSGTDIIDRIRAALSAWRSKFPDASTTKPEVPKEG